MGIGKRLGRMAKGLLKGGLKAFVVTALAYTAVALATAVGGPALGGLTLLAVVGTGAIVVPLRIIHKIENRNAAAADDRCQQMVREYSSGRSDRHDELINSSSARRQAQQEWEEQQAAVQDSARFTRDAVAARTAEWELEQRRAARRAAERPARRRGFNTSISGAWNASAADGRATNSEEEARRRELASNGGYTQTQRMIIMGGMGGGPSGNDVTSYSSGDPAYGSGWGQNGSSYPDSSGGPGF